MFVVHIDLKVNSKYQAAFTRTWHEIFYPAVSAQPGFQRADLLQPAEESLPYCLVLVFDKHSSQQAWVATDLHQQVWPKIAGHCGGFAVRTYHTL